MAIVILGMLGIAWNQNWDITPIPYAECTEHTCKNPFYKTECKQALTILWIIPLYTTQDCTSNEKNSWVTQPTLTKGTYGTPPHPLIKYGYAITILLLITTIIINHYTHNKGKPFDIEICISKKHRYSIITPYTKKK